MEDTIYYDENLFYVNEIINTVGDGFRLDLHASIFLDKVVEDVLFVESALAFLFAALRENELLINRAEHLRRMLRTKSRYSDVLDMIVNESHSLSEQIAPFFSKFKELSAGQRADMVEIRNILFTQGDLTTGESDVVSEAEIRFLLKEEDSEEPA